MTIGHWKLRPPGGQIYQRMGILMAAKKFETINVSPKIKQQAKDILARLEQFNEKYPNEMGKPSLGDLIDLALTNFSCELDEIEEGTDSKEVWW